MSRDIVALVRERPDTAGTLAELRLATTEGADGSHVYDAAGRLLVTVPAAIQVQVPGEIERLLGAALSVPVWWVDVRAAADLPGAIEIGDRIAERLVARHGGALWRGDR